MALIPKSVFHAFWWRQETSQRNTGKSHPQSEETRRKISFAQRGVRETEESRRRNREAQLRREWNPSEEWRRKHIEAHKGIPRILSDRVLTKVEIRERSREKRVGLPSIETTLNESVAGSHLHHTGIFLDGKHVGIYLPRWMHKKTWHSLIQNRNMERINWYAAEWLIREWKVGVFDFMGLKIRKKNWEE